MSMAERIRYLVKINPKSRRQIAAELFIAPDSLSSYINGRRSPDAAMVSRLAAYFHVPADYILGVNNFSEKQAAPADPVQEELLLDLFHKMTPVQRAYFLDSGYGIAFRAKIAPFFPACQTTVLH